MSLISRSEIMLFLPKMAASFCNLVGLLQHNTRIFSALPLKNNLSFASWIRLKAWVILNIMTDWVTFYLSRISFSAMHKECMSHTPYKKSSNCRIRNLCVSSNVHYPPTCSCRSTEGKGAKSINCIDCNCISISQVFQSPRLCSFPQQCLDWKCTYF